LCVTIRNARAPVKATTRGVDAENLTTHALRVWNMRCLPRCMPAWGPGTPYVYALLFLDTPEKSDIRYVNKGTCMARVAVLILGAGKGTRMRSGLVKVLHPILGQPMLALPLKAAADAVAPEKIVVVVGYQGDRVRAALADPSLTFVDQTEQLGTGHAVLSAEPVLGSFEGTILILCGDVPLITSFTLAELLRTHRNEGATVTALTAHVEDPSGYGRIIRTPSGEVEGIMEEKDASLEQRAIREINSGIYCVESSFLFPALHSLGSDNAQEEYYLPDIVAVARAQGEKTAAYVVPDASEAMGVNTRSELALTEEILKARANGHSAKNHTSCSRKE